MARSSALCLAAAVLALATPGHAAVPPLMPLQGIVADNAGVPVTDGDFAVTFSLYTAVDAATPTWTESWPPAAGDCLVDATDCVAVRSGTFAVALGTFAPLSADVFDGSAALWLGVSVEGEPELERRPLGTTAFAFRAASAEIASGLDCVGCIGADALAPELAEALETGSTPPDGLDEISNGTLTNEFERSHAAAELPATLAVSVDVQIEVPQAGTIRDIGVAFELNHPFVPDLDVRLLRPGDAVGIQLIAPGGGQATSVAAEFGVVDVLPEGGTLAALIGQAQAGTWILRVTDTLINGNEGQGSLTNASLTITYLAEEEVGIKLPGGAVQLLGPEQSETLTTLVEQVAALQAEIWCLKHCDAQKISDCQDRDCDGTEQTCDPAGPQSDGTVCLGGVGVCLDGACCLPASCSTLGVQCGQTDDGCGGVLSCGACSVSEVCVSGSCALYGSDSAAPGESCKDIVDKGASTGDGLYWIKPDGEAASKVFCDVATSGGGWVLTMQIAGGGGDGTFGYQSDYWTTTSVFNEVAPAALTNIDAKYDTFNTYVSQAGRVLLIDRDTGHHSVLEIPGLTGNTLLDRFSTLGKTNLVHIAGQASPQELMGYPPPTNMCGGAPSRWMINMLSSHSGVRLGNDVATNDQVTNSTSSWPCYNGEGMNLAYGGVGGTLESSREWQDSYGSESLNRWRDNGGTGQGSHNGVAIFVQ